MLKLLRLLFLAAFLFIVSQAPLHAQRHFGVVWDIPENPQTAVHQLQKFGEMGITAVEIKEQPLPTVWNKIDELNFKVYGNLGIQFPLTRTFAKPDSSFIRLIERRASAFLGRPSVQALGLFEFGPVHNTAFVHAIEPFVIQLKKAGGIDIYFASTRTVGKNNKIADFSIYFKRVTSQNIHSLSIPESPSIRAYRFGVNADLDRLFKPFYSFLEATSVNHQKIVFVDSNWLFSIIEKYPWFDQTLHALATEAEAVFPIPDESIPGRNDSAIPILILLSIWGMAALLYSSDPIYRKSLFRYVSGHKFFLKDIFDRHMRSPWPALIIILQNALLLSLAAFTTFSAIFSPLGEAAFFYHFPVLSILGEDPFSLFIWTLFSTLIFSFASIIWLSVFHNNLNSIWQMATIFAWPLQINIIIITIAIVIFASGSHGLTVLTFSLLAFLILLLSFIFTSFDSARFIEKKSKLYLLGTSGLYLILIGSLIAWLLTQNTLWDVISLSMSLK